MHFFKNSVSFIAVMCICGAAFSAARVGVNTTAANPASRRLASLSNLVKTTVSSATTTTTNSSSSSSEITLSDPDCIEEYRSCMKSSEACGSGFEDCTTNVLFHGHMAECFSTLYQCSSSGIQSLFGTNNIGDLSKVELCEEGTLDSKTGECKEVRRYAYPTDGSVMGIDIIGAATRNKLSTSDCVKKYKNCLTKDSVCGEDFELCTTESEFKKQAVLCDSVLSRCQKEGFQQLFGENIKTKPSNKDLKPKDPDSDTYKWMTDGAVLAASNAVNTCYKVVDTCFMNACAKNPYRCVEGISYGVLANADFVANGTKTASSDTSGTETTTSKEVRKFFRAACQDTIGANKYCYMTFMEKNPSKTDLDDAGSREEVFNAAYDARNKKDILGEKITQLVEKFDVTAKNKCTETFKSCAVRSCGGGSGAACYARVFGKSDNTSKGLTIDMGGSINVGDAYKEVFRGCSGAVNMDANCAYMAAVQSDGNNFNFDIIGSNDSGVFNTLFPEYKSTGDDKYPIVAALNAELSATYNDAAIEKMKKQCQNVVANCVRSMCGANYQNCYRNRNDISLNTYDTKDPVFNASMNKVGGVLDYTIVQGLCSNTVKNSANCAESLAIAKLGVQDSNGDVVGSWGTINNDTTISSAWRDSANTNYSSSNMEVQAQDDSKRLLCECTNGNVGVCDTEVGGVTGCSEPYMVSQSIANDNAAVNKVFKEVLIDVEMEAQAQYKAKLTKEQNICLAQNSGSNPNPAFVWSKFKKNKKFADSSTYSTKGLNIDDVTSSNDLYDSFCRVKVEIRSDDRDVQKLLGGEKITTAELKNVGAFGIDWLAKDEGGETVGSGKNESYAYFSTGDAFTCGSWISDGNIEAITKKVGADARKAAGQGSAGDEATMKWVTIGAGALGSVGSFIGMNALQTNGSSLGGLLNTNTTSANTLTKSQKEAVDECLKKVDAARTKLRSTTPTDSASMNALYDAAILAKNEANKANVGKSVEFKKPSSEDTCEWNEKYAPEWVAQSDTCCTTNGRESDCKAALAQMAVLVNRSCEVRNKTQVENLVTRVTQGGCSLYNPYVDKGKQWSDASILSTYQTNLDYLYDNCKKAQDGEETDEDRSKRLRNNLIASAVGGIATTALASGIVSSAQKAKYENAENEAVKKWFENVGSKIHCYVNGEFVGDYGDIVTVNITED